MVMSHYAASMEPPRRAARSRLRLLRAMRRCRKGDAIVPQAVPAKAPTPAAAPPAMPVAIAGAWKKRSEEHTSELQSLMRISYAVFCLKKKTNITDRRQKTSADKVR